MKAVSSKYEDLPLDSKIDLIRKRIKLVDALEMADFCASREDWSYDPDGEAGRKSFEKRIKLNAELNRLLTLKRECTINKESPS